MMEAIYSSETSDLPKPHGVTSQKTAFFIVTAVKTSNITSFHPDDGGGTLPQNVGSYKSHAA
jgi:hypothetical protein